MNNYRKAYDKLWSVLRYEPACKIEKSHRENIKRLETLEPLVEHVPGIEPAKHVAGHTYCSGHKAVVTNKYDVDSLSFYHKHGQPLD